MHPTLVLTLCFITGIKAPPVQPSTSCSAPCDWTPWINVDRPTNKTDGGDFETLDRIREAGYRICQAPWGIHCRSVRFPYVPFNELKDVAECRASNGLTCSNQDNGGECLDYEVQFLCCPCHQISNSPEKRTPPPLEESTGSADNNSQKPNCYWSQWFNVYRPTSGPDGGDFETFENIRAEGHAVCSAPQAVSCRLARFPYIPLDQLSYTQECGVSLGLVCENKNQGNDSCLDYEIKILCCTYDNPTGAPLIDPSILGQKGQLVNATEATKITTTVLSNNNPEATPLFDKQETSSGMEEVFSPVPPASIATTLSPNNNPEVTPLFDEQGSSYGMEEVFSPVPLASIATTVSPNNNPEVTPLFDEQGISSGMEEVFSPVPLASNATTVSPNNNPEVTPLFDEQGISNGMEKVFSPVPLASIATTVPPNNNPEVTPLFDEQGSSSGMEEDVSTKVKMTVFPNNNETTPVFEEQGSSSGMEEVFSPEPLASITTTVPPNNNPESSPLFEEQGSSSGMEEVFSSVPSTTITMTVLPDNTTPSGMEELNSPEPSTTITIRVHSKKSFDVSSLLKPYTPIFFIDPIYSPTEKPIDEPLEKKEEYPMPSSPIRITFPTDYILDGSGNSIDIIDMVDNLTEQENAQPTNSTDTV